MMTESNRLPDVLRPTELHDFSDVFATRRTRRGHAKAVLIGAALAALIRGDRATDAAAGPSSPATPIAARRPLLRGSVRNVGWYRHAWAGVMSRAEDDGLQETRAAGSIPAVR
ncbi:MAG: hypothetical protein ACRYHQ_25805 [Janthinobacterium lividum]